MFAPRERAVWCVGIGAVMVVLSGVGYLSGTILPDRRATASAMFAAGLVIVWLSVRWLRHLKQSTDPRTTWWQFLRRERYCLCLLVALGGLFSLLPKDTLDDFRAGMRDVIEALQTLSPGPGPPRLR